MQGQDQEQDPEFLSLQEQERQSYLRALTRSPALPPGAPSLHHGRLLTDCMLAPPAVVWASTLPPRHQVLCPHLTPESLRVGLSVWGHVLEHVPKHMLDHVSDRHVPRCG